MKDDPTGLMATQLGLPERVITEAMEWLVLSWSGETGQEFERSLQTWLNQDRQHQQAWQYLKNISGQLDRVPTKAATNSLRSADKVGSRRRFLSILVALFIGVAVTPLLLRHRYGQSLMADLRTQTGEIKTHILEDGTRLIMNTDSSVDLHFSAELRVIELISGEVQITTANDQLGRPFKVNTREGSIQPVGTVFTVRNTAHHTAVSVQEGAVKIASSNHSTVKINAGNFARFNASELVTGSNTSEPDWVHGKFSAEQMRLDQFFAEISRYRKGIIRVHPEIASMRLTGRFDLHNTDRTLEMVEKAFPVNIEYFSSYWVNINPQ